MESASRVLPLTANRWTYTSGFPVEARRITVGRGFACGLRRRNSGCISGRGLNAGRLLLEVSEASHLCSCIEADEVSRPSTTFTADSTSRWHKCVYSESEFQTVNYRGFLPWGIINGRLPPPCPSSGRSISARGGPAVHYSGGRVGPPLRIYY